MEPLLARIKEKRDTLVVPVIDRISALSLDYGYSIRYFKVGRGLKCSVFYFKLIIVKPKKEKSTGKASGTHTVLGGGVTRKV